MKNLVFIIGILSVLDLGVIPMLLSSVRKTGGFHYLTATIHKLTFMILILLAGFLIFRNETHGLLFEFIFCATLLFIFNSAFEFNDYMFKTFEPDKYSLEGMTEEGKELMQYVFEDMRDQNRKPLTKRFEEMIHNFTTNLNQDFKVVFMALTNDKIMKESFLELHRMMGNDVKFSTMTNKEMFFVVKNRIAIDVSVIVFSVLILTNLV